jgi:hypothetical protein
MRFSDVGYINIAIFSKTVINRKISVMTIDEDEKTETFRSLTDKKLKKDNNGKI